MRNLSFKWCKWDKRYFIAALITLICSIICGIILYKFVSINIYFNNYAKDYIYYIFNFKNSKILISHFLSELFYFYIFFFIGYFTKFKYVTLLFIFLRGLYFSVYTAILIGFNAFGGVTVAVLVFIPISLISIFLCCVIADCCKIVNKKYVFFLPLILAAVNTFVLLVMVNVVFRVIIVIV